MLRCTVLVRWAHLQLNLLCLHVCTAPAHAAFYCILCNDRAAAATGVFQAAVLERQRTWREPLPQRWSTSQTSMNSGTDISDRLRDSRRMSCCVACAQHTRVNGASSSSGLHWCWSRWGRCYTSYMPFRHAYAVSDTTR